MRRFTDEEKKQAVNLYFDEKLTTEETVERLGYPTRQNLERWLKRDPRYGETFCHGFYPIETKIMVVGYFLKRFKESKAFYFNLKEQSVYYISVAFNIYHILCLIYYVIIELV